MLRLRTRPWVQQPRASLASGHWLSDLGHVAYPKPATAFLTVGLRSQQLVLTQRCTEEDVPSAFSRCQSLLLRHRLSCLLCSQRRCLVHFAFCRLAVPGTRQFSVQVCRMGTSTQPVHIHQAPAECQALFSTQGMEP